MKTLPALIVAAFTATAGLAEKGPHQFQYSVFWGTGNADIAVVSISGTTNELWQETTKIFDTMSSFEVLDMKKIEDAAKREQGAK